MPLESIHKAAFTAARGTHCAQEQGKFWEMHERLFAYQQELDQWSTHASALALDVGQFEACLRSDKYTQEVRADMAVAQQAGARGTPSFLLARTDPANPARVVGITLLRGAQPFTNFKAEIDKALSQNGERGS